MQPATAEILDVVDQVPGEQFVQPIQRAGVEQMAAQATSSWMATRPSAVDVTRRP